MKTCFLLIGFLALRLPVDAQKIDSAVINSKGKIFDFVETDGSVFAISDGGSLFRYEIHDPNQISTLITIPGDKILSIATNKSGDVFTGTQKGMVYKLSTDGRLLPFLKAKYPVKFLVINSENHVITIVPNAVFDPISGKHWENFGNHTSGLVVERHGKRIKEYFQMPQYVFLDDRDILWMTASFGEFGGDIQVFDTRALKIVNNKFDSIDNGLFFPKSVFEGPEGKVLVTSGLQHFANSGEIFAVEANGKAIKLYESSGLPVYKDRKSREIIKEGGLFIGPGAYNPSDSCIYFASNKGIHKARMTRQMKLSEPMLLENIEIDWSREPMAIGIKMAFKKLTFNSGGELIFLTENNGIGILRNGKVSFLQD